MTQLTIEAEKIGVPASAIVAEGFVTTARITGAYQGVEIIRTAVYPGAFDISTVQELEDNFEQVILPQAVANLTTPLDPSEVYVVENANPTDVVFTGTLDEVNAYFLAKNYNDGSPIVPPTMEKIQEFMQYTDRSPHEVLGTLYPSNTAVTPWNIAVNAVMAGAKPEHMPILIAMIEGMSDYDVSKNYGSTHSWVPYAVVNGPITEQLGVSHGQGLITDPVNRALGRTCELFIHNLFGVRIKELRLGTFGYVKPWVIAEDEEYLDSIDWEPYHVKAGGYTIKKTTNTVSMASSVLIGGNLCPAEFDAEIILQLMALDAIAKGYVFGKDYTILITRAVADILANAGYNKDSISDYLMTVGRKITYTYTFAQVYGSPGFIYPGFEEQLSKNNRSADPGLLPPWFGDFDGAEDVLTSPGLKRDITILVNACASRNKAQVFTGDPVGEPIVVTLPSNWDDLMSNLGYPPLNSFYR